MKSKRGPTEKGIGVGPEWIGLANGVRTPTGSDITIVTISIRGDW